MTWGGIVAQGWVMGGVKDGSDSERVFVLSGLVTLRWLMVVVRDGGDEGVRVRFGGLCGPAVVDGRG